MKCLINRSFLLGILCLLLLSTSSKAIESIVVGSTTRTMIVYAPSGIPANRPLVINLHGMNQNAAYQQSQAKWEPIADAEKFVVVYPNGINNSWDLSGTTDIDFIIAIINNMYSRFGIDKNRVYLSGFSMGGMMTYYAATKIADKIAAFAPVSGYLMGGPNTNSSRPIPIIHTHGTADNVVAYSGVQTCLNAWITRNGCPSKAVVTDPYPASLPNSICTKYYWGKGTNGVEIVLMSLEGKGHWWSMDVANGISTSQEIWNFCKNYSLNNSCTPTSITPYLQVNDGTWQQTSSVTVSSGAKVKFGPQPASGGSWSWSGCGTSGTSREQTVYPANSCTATATYTNSCGATSTQDFNIMVSGGSSDIADGGVYRITPRNGGKALDVSGCGTADGTNVRNWSWLNNDCQKWQFTSLSGGYWRISPMNATGKALDVNGISTADGANVQIWNYGGGNNQQWQVVNLNNGYYQIEARHSGKCLDLSNGSTTDGANIQQWTCSSSNTNQHFTFTRIKSAEEVLPGSLTDYSLHPSPANKNLNITFREQYQVNVKIYNNIGVLVLSSKLTGNSKTIDVSRLSPGIYIIRLEGETKTITDRFIKK